MPNVIINASVAMIMAMIQNFKLSEKESLFKQINSKMTRHCYAIEDMLNNSLQTLDSEDVSKVILEYDNIVDMNEYTFPNHIKRNVTSIYKRKRVLPSVLNCIETDFSLSMTPTPTATINIV